MDFKWFVIMACVIVISLTVGKYIETYKEIEFSKAGLEQCVDNTWKRNCK